MYKTSRSLSRSEYEKANRLAKKDFLANISKGKEGYLPCLEDIIHNVEIIKEEKLGLIDIPIERIKGTYYHSRSLLIQNLQVNGLICMKLIYLKE